MRRCITRLFKMSPAELFRAKNSSTIGKTKRSRRMRASLCFVYYSGQYGLTALTSRLLLCIGAL
ncbi:hypothetical protein AB9M62_28445 [Bacillales bacterium AN1005]